MLGTKVSGDLIRKPTETDETKENIVIQIIWGYYLDILFLYNPSLATKYGLLYFATNIYRFFFFAARIIARDLLNWY